MFTRTPEVAEARRTIVRAQMKPAIGTILRGIQKKLPVRLHCQQARGRTNEIFMYGSVLPLDTALTVDGQKWFLRDFASIDLTGTKAVLTQKARDRVLKHFDKHPVFADCDILPVVSLRVVKVPASNRSVEVDVHEMAPDATTQVCALLAEILMDTETSQESRELALKAFYEYFETSHETRTAAEGPAA